MDVCLCPHTKQVNPSFVSLSLSLGRDWVWAPDTKDDTYLRVLRMFEDHKLATFSLHIISQLGVDEGKPIGEWYGPNTVAQVLRCVGVEE